MRIAVEESGHQDYKFSSTGYEPNDYVLTETCVEFNQESVTEQRSPEGLDYDDAVIGQTLFNSYRRWVDHSEGEGLSSCLSSSSMSHDRTVKLVVCCDIIHEQGQEIQRQNYESEQIRTIFWTDKGSKSSLIAKRRLEHTNSRLIMTEEVHKN